ncbi:MAG: hypothetical protein K6E29_09390 [Cyanobacteria bacterium RUI128]|nr:hypothetical protein [Cyanobacteria bacterium RUI128]
MSTVTQLLCNRFGGIRHRNSSFSDELITASDIQNVELYYTGINSGIGIRTMKGNVSANDSLKDSERIIDIFQSVQKSETIFFVYTETISDNEANIKGKFYLYDINTDTLILKKDNIEKSGVCNGFDVAQGYSDLFFFTNGKCMFTYETGITQTLYAYVYDTHTIYADSATTPTTLYTSSGETYTGIDWAIDNGTVKYNSNSATYTSSSDIITDTIIRNMSPTDRNGNAVLGLGATLFNNRLFIFDKNVLWYSVTANIYDFATYGDERKTSAGYIETTKNITAIHEYLGSLAVFYKNSSQLLTVSNGDFSLGEDSPGGCANYNSLVFHGTDLYFYDDTKKGVFAFKQVVNGDKTLSDNLAVDIQEELINIDSSSLDKIKTLSVVLSERNEIWWIVPTVDSEYSKVLIYDYIKGEWVKRKSQKINSVRVIDDILYSAGDDGTILREYQTNTFNGEYIPHYYNCSPLNLGADNTLKILGLQPRVSLDLPYNNKFKVKYVKNFDTQKKPKVKLIKTKYKNFLVWGLGKWGEAYWRSKNTNSIGKFPNANFKILEISIYTDDNTQDFSIRKIEFSKIKVKQV